MDVASLIVKVSTTGVQTTQAQLDKLSATASNAQKSAGGLNLGMIGLTATLGLLTKEAIKMGDEWTNINSKLNLVTKTTQDFNKAQTELFNISQNTRTSLSASVELYRKLAVSTESLNISQNRLLKVTETINKAGMVGGGSKESINAALIQLGQGLASGALRGEELNSVLEQTPRLAKLIADGMGVQVGALKSLAEAGKITSETIIKAAEAGEKGIAKEFDVVQATISSAMDVIEGSITKTVGTLDSATGATRSLSMAMIELSKDINQNNTDIVATGQFIYATISRTIDVFNVLYESVENTVQIVIGHINLLAYGSLEVILTMLTKVTEGLNVLGLASDKGLKEAYSDLAYVQGLVTNANNLIADSYDDLNKAVIKLSPTIEDRIKGYNAENKAITEKLELQKKELAQNQTKGKSKLEVEAELKLEKEKQEAEKKSKQQAIKLAEDWSKRNIEITTNMAIAQQDELAKPFIVLEAKYKEDLETFKGVKGAKERLTLEYNENVKRELEDMTKKFNKEEEAKAKKSAEWQVKILEANEKYNDEIIKMQDEMYGTDTTVDSWYNNQLEYLGKLSQEAGATAEELQTLLDKIETLKAMKLQKQTISFKLEQSFYSSFENNLADSIEGAFNGKLNLSSFFKSIGQDVLRTFSGGIANNFTSAMRTGSFTTGLSALGLGSTSAVAGDSGGSLLSDLSTLSTIKSLYGLVSDGLGSTVMSGFSGLSNLTGMSGISQFGYGFTNPFASSQLAGLYGSGVPELSGLSSIGSTAGGMALGGLGGYALGSLGDKLFGADTKAGTYGAIGGALGSLGGPIGIAIGAGLGSIIGGLFGSTKQTDAGLNFGSTTGAGQGFNDIQSYTSMKKKSWFSSSSWTNYADLTSSEKKQIESIFTTYDFLLTQLGDTDKVIIEAGKYTGQSFQDVVSKKFIEAFTDVSQTTDATIYNAWVDYAKSIDKTIIEALSISINTFISATRTFDVWALNRSGQGIEALAKQAQWAQEDFSNLSNMLGVTGVTVENYTQMYKEAVKNSLTPETITQWQSLGTALQTATNASDAFKNSIISGLQQDLTAWISTLGSIQNAMDNLNPTFMTFAELASQTVNLDNYSTLLSQLEKTRQSEISKLTETSNLRIAQLEKEKDYFVQIMDYVDELTKRMNVQTTTLGTFFYVELQKAKDNFAKGSEVNIANLNTSASSYLDSVKENSATQRDYFFEVAKVRNELSDFGTNLAEGGSLEGIENAILTEQNTLAQKLDAINQTALAILQGYKGTATGAISSITSKINTVKAIDPSITAAYANILGRAPEEAGGAHWQKQLDTGTISSENITTAIAAAAVEELYSTVLGRTSDAAGLAHWTNVVQSGSINPTQLDEMFKEAAKAELDGSHANGLGFVPFDGYKAELHKGERVLTANDNSGLKEEMIGIREENSRMVKLMVKLVSDNTKQLSTQRAILGEKVAI